MAASGALSKGGGGSGADGGGGSRRKTAYSVAGRSKPSVGVNTRRRCLSRNSQRPGTIVGTTGATEEGVIVVGPCCGEVEAVVAKSDAAVVGKETTVNIVELEGVKAELDGGEKSPETGGGVLDAIPSAPFVSEVRGRLEAARG